MKPNPRYGWQGNQGLKRFAIGATVRWLGALGTDYGDGIGTIIRRGDWFDDLWWVEWHDGGVWPAYEKHMEVIHEAES